MSRLTGKVALITGAARGQGAAEARRFVAEGAKVVIADVLETEGRALAAELGEAACFHPLDVTCAEQWQACVEMTQAHFGKLDVLVNNAAILRMAPLEQCSLEDYRRVIDVNQVGCWLGMKSVLAAMRQAGGGSIINVSSTAGMEGVAYGTAYSASKFAVRGMTKSAALELGSAGIRVNSVHPGGIDTVMSRPPEMAGFDPAQIYSGLPIPRIGQPEEVASLVLFLASDESSYCTGSEFIIDGGMLAGSTFG
ncbi:glucose 1-dehydrogenase [Pseudomonas sp.]|uniref:glucose 1-dehydrogenase n=1 Tax=Pseudomonas sp. TaxID=306 RepID=UPI001B03A95F|nr:glucose 1-dehydrogenase [Pseudomonas sp.]MBO9549401.1 glucose 1-dehydrogenase [Pseudomonas sp.]